MKRSPYNKALADVIYSLQSLFKFHSYVTNGSAFPMRDNSDAIKKYKEVLELAKEQEPQLVEFMTSVLERLENDEPVSVSLEMNLRELWSLFRRFEQSHLEDDPEHEPFLDKNLEWVNSCLHNSLFRTINSITNNLAVDFKKVVHRGEIEGSKGEAHREAISRGYSTTKEFSTKLRNLPNPHLALNSISMIAQDNLKIAFEETESEKLLDVKSRTGVDMDRINELRRDKEGNLAQGCPAAHEPSKFGRVVALYTICNYVVNHSEGSEKINDLIKSQAKFIMQEVDIRMKLINVNFGDYYQNEEVAESIDGIFIGLDLHQYGELYGLVRESVIDRTVVNDIGREIIKHREQFGS
jgi:hypothetical protein